MVRSWRVDGTGGASWAVVRTGAEGTGSFTLQLSAGRRVGCNGRPTAGCLEPVTGTAYGGEHTAGAHEGLRGWPTLHHGVADRLNLSGSCRRRERA